MGKKTKTNYTIEDLTYNNSYEGSPFNHPLLKLLDPTGITSWHDVYKSYTTDSSLYDKIINTIQVIPSIGKVGNYINTIGNILGLKDDFETYYNIENHNDNSIFYNEKRKLLGPYRIIGTTRHPEAFDVHPATSEEIQYWLDNREHDDSVLEYIRKQFNGGKLKLIPRAKSGIHIKKQNRGKFTEYCGGKVTDECIQKAKRSGNLKLIKRATFAQNARKWNK